jgi:hypothetical protein
VMLAGWVLIPPSGFLLPDSDCFYEAIEFSAMHSPAVVDSKLVQKKKDRFVFRRCEKWRT